MSKTIQDARRSARGSEGNLRMLMRVCSDVAERIPMRQDGVLRSAVKLVAIAEAVRRRVQGEESPVQSFVRFRDLERTRNRQLVELFFMTPLADIFEVSRVTINEGHSLLRAAHPDFGELCFNENSWGGDLTRTADFYHSRDFDFAGMMAALWDAYDGAISVTAARGTYPPTLRFGALPLRLGPLYGTARERLDRFVEKHQRIASVGATRSYLFVGAPGTGKSTMAQAAMNRIGDRVLRLEAKSLEVFGPDEMRFLVEHLNPTGFIIDDVDKINFEDCLPTLLTVLEWVKVEHPEVAVLMTANGTEMHPAVMRPGRIDEVVWFDIPDADDRKAILLGYLGDDHGVADEDIDRLVDETAKLSPAWLEEIALQLRFESVERVSAIVADMLRLVAGSSLSLADELEAMEAAALEEAQPDAPDADPTDADPADADPADANPAEPEAEESEAAPLSP